MADDNVSLLIDYENVGLDSIQYLVDQLSGIGRIIVKRAYADWSSQRSKQDQLLELGIEAIHNFRSTKSGKNSCDIRLTIDAIDLLYSAPIDTFVIVSSDSDFVPLVSKLRSAGKTVMGAGRRAVTSATLVKSCDRYFYLDDNRLPTRQNNARKATITPHERLVISAVEASMDDEGHAIGSKVAQSLQRLDPSFSFTSLGFRSFGAFLESCQDLSITRRKGKDVLIQLHQGKSSDRTEESYTTPMPVNWEGQINAAWDRRQQARISGQAAASDAATALGLPRLRDSKYPTIDKLLAASQVLNRNWTRDRNYILKKVITLDDGPSIEPDHNENVAGDRHR